MSRPKNHRRTAVLLASVLTVTQSFADTMQDPVCVINQRDKDGIVVGRKEVKLSPEASTRVSGIEFEKKDDDADQVYVKATDFRALSNACEQHLVNTNDALVHVVIKETSGNSWFSWFNKVKDLIIKPRSENILTDSFIFGNDGFEIVAGKNTEDRVFTAYFSGTSAHAGDVTNAKEYIFGEHVAAMASLSEESSEHGVDFAHLNGPGSGNRSNHTRRVHHDQLVPDSLGQASGRGTKENVDDMVAVIKNESQNPATKSVQTDIVNRKALNEFGDIVQVNCFGWSRGAVQCLELAARLYHDQDEKIRALRVNIFAIDPVPGLGNYSFWWSDIDTLYPNVKNYQAVYARHEASVGFTPIIPVVVDSSETKVWMEQLPGYHATLSGNHNNSRHESWRKPSDIPLVDVGIIVRDMAEKFLVAHGTRLPKDKLLNLSTEAVIAHYENAYAHMDLYEKLSRESYLLGITQLFGSSRKISMRDEEKRNFFSKKLLLDDVFNVASLPAGFVNHHHRKLVEGN